jgi:hypothetical protein
MSLTIYRDLRSQLLSNSYDVGRNGVGVRMLCCHNTAGPNDHNYPGQSAQNSQALSDAAALYLAGNDRQASVHWLIGGEACGAPIYAIVPEEDTAYHCGGPNGLPSSWTDPTTGLTHSGYGNNLVSIGIEIMGQPNEVLGPNQLRSAQLLVMDIATRHSILQHPSQIVAHADIDTSRTDGRDWRNQAQGWVVQVGAKPMADNTDPMADPNVWHCLATDKYVTNQQGFLDFWRSHGALAVLGFPTSGAAPDPKVLDKNGNQVITQYFERARFEYHPENQAPYTVLLGRLGVEVQQKDQVIAQKDSQIAALAAQVSSLQSKLAAA